MASDEILPGLPPGSVVLAEHTAQWAALYAEEEARLREALGPLAMAIEHYGSTAIPGIQAKPILDILVGVHELGDALKAVSAMETVGYYHDAKAGIPGHEIFAKGIARTHIAHFVEYESDRWWEAIRFRDRLRADPEAAKAYEQLKVELAALHPNDRAAYTAGKTEFVERLQAPTSTPDPD